MGAAHRVLPVLSTSNKSFGASDGMFTISNACAITLNFVRMDVDAHVSNTGATQTVIGRLGISVKAQDGSRIETGAGALGLTVGPGTSIAASVAVDDIRNSIRARINKVKLDA